MQLEPARKGAIFGLLSAALFGVSAPIAKVLLTDTSPQLLAGILYLGAGLCISLYRKVAPSRTEAALTKSDIPRLLALIACGGVAGPVLMLFGLDRVGAVTGSLLLNLEAPCTMAIAVLFFREHLGRYAAGAVVLILGGAASLKFETGAHSADLLGILLLTAACLSWAIDNNLTQALSLRDPFAIVQVKTLSAGAFNLVVGCLFTTQPLPSGATVAMALALGAGSYGVSVVLDAYALRLVGAAREAAYFATAPFMGALAAPLITGEALGGWDGFAMLLMGLGVGLLLRERHGHFHTHEALRHSHRHTHDEHHKHGHSPEDPVGEPHAHEHEHEPLAHDHPHVPDVHHRHRHG
jgi:drug/metabolite transporter (DMT)-like permease